MRSPRLARADGKSPLEWKTRVSIAVSVANVLDHLHSQMGGMTHGQLTADSVLINDRDLSVKVVDWGIRRSGAKPFREEELVRMEPDYCQTGRYTPRSDVYSLGVLVLESVTGKCAEEIAAAPSRSASAYDLGSNINVPDSDLARSVARYMTKMELALDHVDGTAGPWPDENALAMVRAGLGAMQIRPGVLLSSADVLTKLMEVHADAQAPSSTFSSIATRGGSKGGGGLTAEAKQAKEADADEEVSCGKVVGWRGELPPCAAPLPAPLLPAPAEASGTVEVGKTG